MFKQVNPKQNFIKLEHQILDFWEKRKIFKKLQEKNRGKKPWSFIDGPITANNPMGVHHAWGRTLKDVFQRYKAMQGYDLRFQNGFDCQGLWVEVEVEKDLGFNSKREIEEYGLENFSRACRARVEKYSKIQTKQSIRLGQWMDWKNSYYTMSDTNIEYIWYFLERCYERGWLYKNYYVMPWCARCGTSLSQHELADVYEEVEHKAVYVKLKLKTRNLKSGADEYFLVWTTTPWTLTSNVALAVHPNITYVKVKSQKPKVKNKEEILILAKGKLDVLDEEFEIIEEIKGKNLIGLKYEGPFDDLPVQKNITHKVIPWKEVGEEEGTGIVHIAPGCGAEDFELSKEHDLAVIAPLDENGNYVRGFGWLSYKNVKEITKPIIEELKRKQILYKTEMYRHRYPSCWRCKEELVFRAVSEWFIKADEIRPYMKREAEKVRWIPPSAGKRMQNWLDNMQDWVISRKRYWGLPLPFYECECGELTVIQSKFELRKLATQPLLVDRLPELHRPWIDEIRIECPKCGREVKRIPDVGDCWLDAGIVPFSTLKYLEDKKYWMHWFPAEFICEMREQIRLWFYSLLFMSVTLEGKTPYKNVLSYEKVYDEKGKPMHKSAGNVIWFDEAVEKMGADCMRWMYCAQNPAINLRFGYGPAQEIKQKLIQLWNVYSFFVMYARIDGFKPCAQDLNSTTTPSSLLDRWILSVLNQVILDARRYLDDYKVTGAIKLFENFLDNLANWYVRRSRRRFWKAKNDKDKKQAYQTLYQVLIKFIQLFAPIVPFICEEIYQNLTSGLKLKDQSPKSVHLCDYPQACRSLIDEKLNKKMAQTRRIVTLGHAARDNAKIRVRQPLSKLFVFGLSSVLKLEKEFVDLIKEEVNVKNVILGKDFEKYVSREIKPNWKLLGKKYKGKIGKLKAALALGWQLKNGKLISGKFILEPEEYEIAFLAKPQFSAAYDKNLLVVLDKTVTLALKQEGMVRDIIRRIQDMRKEANYKVDRRIIINYEDQSLGKELKKAIEKFTNYIKKETLSKDVVCRKIKDCDIEKEVKIAGLSIWIGLKRATKSKNSKV